MAGRQTQSMENQAEDAVEAVAEAAERRPWLSITAITGAIFALLTIYEPLKDIYKQITDPVYKDVASVPFADFQKQLWVKNSGCLTGLVMKESVLQNAITLRAGACPNRDVLVQIFPKATPALSNWISFDNLRQPKTAAADGLFSAAAAPFVGALLATDRGNMISIDEETVSTMCQAWADPSRQSHLIRIVNENGRCYKEVTNVYSGRVEYREAVSCDASCK